MNVKNIPLISATYPNYVGVTGNPFFVLLNSSLQAHLEGLYKHMQRYYNAQNIVAVTKKGGNAQDLIVVSRYGLRHRDIGETAGIHVQSQRAKRRDIRTLTALLA